jgi:hypothetical protein
LLDGKSRRIVEFPVDVALAGVERASVAASHRDDDVRCASIILAKELGELATSVETTFSKCCDDRRVELIGGFRACGADLDAALCVMVEQDLGSEAAASVVDAKKEDDRSATHSATTGSSWSECGTTTLDADLATLG